MFVLEPSVFGLTYSVLGLRSSVLRQQARQPASQQASQPASKPAGQQANSKPASKPSSKAAIWPASKPTRKSASQPASQPANKPANQQASQWASQQKQPAIQRASQPANKPASHQATKPTRKLPSMGWWGIAKRIEKYAIPDISASCERRTSFSSHLSSRRQLNSTHPLSDGRAMLDALLRLDVWKVCTKGSVYSSDTPRRCPRRWCFSRRCSRRWFFYRRCCFSRRCPRPWCFYLRWWAFPYAGLSDALETNSSSCGLLSFFFFCCR